MKRVGIKAQVGYRSPRARKGEASIVSPNRLQRQFNPDAPDERWVTDITYIRTHEGWLYLAVVVDLFSRKIIGWSMQSRMTKDIVLNALLMAVWRRNPQKQVLVHSDQGSQYTSYEWQSFLQSLGLECSMSRRGNCHDNAVAESFFQLLKRERIKKKIYGTREEARSDIRLHSLSLAIEITHKFLCRNQIKPVVKFRLKADFARYERSAPGDCVQRDTGKITPSLYEYASLVTYQPIQPHHTANQYRVE